MFLVKISLSLLCGYSYNDIGTLVGFEKGDALYRETVTLGNDYHTGMFGKFYMTSDGKPAVNVGNINDNPGSSSDLTIDNVKVHVDVSKSEQKSFWHGALHWTQLYNDMYLREWELTVTSTNLPHRKSTIDALQKAVVKAYGEEHLSSDGWHYRGAFQNVTAYNDRSLNGEKRDEILSRAFGDIAYWSSEDNWGWTTGIVDYTGYWDWWGIIPYYTNSFRDLYDIDDVRCDFLTEWAYEKSNIAVWGSDNTLKWLGGGGTNNADYHNDVLDMNDYYTYDELSPMVQSGDFSGNGRDSRNMTTFRGSIVKAPTIEYFQPYAEGPKFQVGDEASTYVYFSILLFNRDGTFARYAKDASGSEYKYRQLYLSRNYGAIVEAGYFPSVFASDNWNNYTVKLVVTDEGANTSELDYGSLSPTLPVNLNIVYAIPPNGPTPRVEDGQNFGPFSTNIYCRYAGSTDPCFFDANLNVNKFYFNGVLGTNLQKGVDQYGDFIEVRIPYGASSGPLYYTAYSNQSNSINFTINAAIEAIQPRQSTIGSKISLLGHDFPTNISRIIFSSLTGNALQEVSTTNFTRIGSTQVDVIVPANAFSGVEMVTGESPVYGGGTYAPYWDFMVKPQITSAPTRIYQNRSFDIVGTGFSATSEVYLGDLKLTVISVTPTAMTVKLPTVITNGVQFLFVKNKETRCKLFWGSNDCPNIPTKEAISDGYQVEAVPPVIDLLLLR